MPLINHNKAPVRSPSYCVALEGTQHSRNSSLDAARKVLSIADNCWDDKEGRLDSNNFRYLSKDQYRKECAILCPKERFPDENSEEWVTHVLVIASVLQLTSMVDAHVDDLREAVENQNCLSTTILQEKLGRTVSTLNVKEPVKVYFPVFSSTATIAEGVTVCAGELREEGKVSFHHGCIYACGVKTMVVACGADATAIAMHDGAKAFANVTGARAYADAAGSNSYADASGAIAYARCANTRSFADVTGACAYADAAGSNSYADASGAIAYARCANAQSFARVKGALAIAEKTSAKAIAYGQNSMSYAQAAGAIATAPGTGAKSFAYERGIAKATGKGAEAHAQMAGASAYAERADTTAYADAKDASAHAQHEGSTAIASRPGAVAKAEVANSMLLLDKDTQGYLLAPYSTAHAQGAARVHCAENVLDVEGGYHVKMLTPTLYSYQIENNEDKHYVQSGRERFVKQKSDTKDPIGKGAFGEAYRYKNSGFVHKKSSEASSTDKMTLSQDLSASYQDISRNAPWLLRYIAIPAMKTKLGKIQSTYQPLLAGQDLKDLYNTGLDQRDREAILEKILVVTRHAHNHGLYLTDQKNWKVQFSVESGGGYRVGRLDVDLDPGLKYGRLICNRNELPSDMSVEKGIEQLDSYGREIAKTYNLQGRQAQGYLLSIVGAFVNLGAESGLSRDHYFNVPRVEVEWFIHCWRAGTATMEQVRRIYDAWRAWNPAALNADEGAVTAEPSRMPN